MVTTNVEKANALASRIALEALRSGVPNREAVRILGCNQDRAEARFSEILDSVSEADNSASGDAGFWRFRDRKVASSDSHGASGSFGEFRMQQR